MPRRMLLGIHLPENFPDNQLIVVVSRQLAAHPSIQGARKSSGVCNTLGNLLGNGNSENRKVRINPQRYRICTVPLNPQDSIETEYYDRSGSIHTYFSPDYETLIIMTKATYEHYSVASRMFTHAGTRAFSGIIEELIKECGLPVHIYKWPQPGQPKALVPFPLTS